MQKQETTDEQQKAYVASGGVKCPFCKGGNLEGSNWNCDSGAAWQDISCTDCGAYWTDIYNLVGMTDIEPPEPRDKPDGE